MLPRVKIRVRIGRWRSDALLQCRYSDIGAMHRHATGSQTSIFTLGVSIACDVASRRTGPVDVLLQCLWLLRAEVTEGTLEVVMAVDALY